GYTIGQGTSFSAPLISGLVALLLEKNPAWSPADVSKALLWTAQDFGADGPDNFYGYGIADGATATVTLAIEMAKSRGRVLLAGLKHSKPVQNFVSDTVVFKSLTIVGGSGFTPGSMRASVDLLAAGRIPTKELLGGVFTIDQIDQAIAYLSRSVPGEDRVRVGLRFD
ncbi:MAG: S8 family serine peptidase, partial [Chloroflexi bacterium]|nr:S8 family serine peptidase [Chloroflexota bacterium]